MSEYEIKVVQSLHSEECSYPDIYLIYVLDGCADVIVDGQRLSLEKSGMIVINPFKKHRWETPAPVTAAAIRMDCRQICRERQLPFIAFDCILTGKTDADDERLREKVEALLYAFITEPEASLKARGLFYLLLDVLFRDYTDKRIHHASGFSDSRQMEKVFQYIHLNYEKKVTLEEVSRLLFMSPSTFSRYFKTKCGINFVDYLNQVRLDRGRELLTEYPSRLVVDIALDCGFSTSSAFNKAFRKQYKMTPSEYRDAFLNAPMNAADTPVNETVNTNVRTVLGGFLAEKGRTPEDEKNVVRKSIVADGTDRLQERRACLAINVGEAGELLMGQQQKHLLIMKNYMGIDYVRLVNVFSQSMNFRQAPGEETLNFDLLDDVLDFLVQNDMKVILDLGDNRKVIIKSNSEFVHPAEKKAFFRDLSDCRNVIESLLNHLVSRYGKRCLAQWIFSVTNEPRELETPEGREAYVQYYTMALMLIKDKIPGVQVSIYGKALGDEMMDYVREWIKLPIFPDYISVDALPYRKVRGKNGEVTGRRSMDPDFIKSEVLRVKRELRDFGLEGIKIMASEWNLNLSDRNYMNDSQIHAAQLMKVLGDVQCEMDFLIYTYGSDLTIRYYETQYSLFGGKGLLSKDGLMKPTCHALAFHRHLLPCIMDRGREYLITTDGKNYALLCYNAKNYTYDYFRRSENEIQPEEIMDFSENSTELELNFSIDHVQNGHYTVRRYILKSENSILHQWLYLGKTEVMDAQTSTYLNQICVPRLQKNVLDIEDHRIALSVPMAAHDIALILINKA